MTRTSSRIRTIEDFSRKAIVIIGFFQILSINTTEFKTPSFNGTMQWNYVLNAWNGIQRGLESAMMTTVGPTITTRETMILTPTNPVHCFNTTYCCGRWETNADDWWQHHPHWEIVLENETSFCFTPTQNPHKIAMLQHLHWTQWNINITANDADPNSTTATSLDSLSSALPQDYQYTVNCSNLCTVVTISSGYGASLQYLYSTFWYAYTRNIPYQIVKRGPWIYTKDTTNTSWAYCDDQDTSCLFLPVSPCSRNYTEQKPKISRRPDTSNETQVLEWLWLRQYMIRPKQIMRHQLYKLAKPYHSQLEDGDCVALHVRRSDAGVPRHPFRRYAPVLEYLDLLPPPDDTNNQTKTIFLMTDDVTTIDEIHRYLMPPNGTGNAASSSPSGQQRYFNWVYTDKQRNRGVEQGFDGHIPKRSDGPLELLYITMELDLASRYCTTLIHGNSGYANMLADAMKMNGRLEAKYFLDTKLERDQVIPFQGKAWQSREEHLLKQVEEFYTNRSKMGQGQVFYNTIK